MPFKNENDAWVQSCATYMSEQAAHWPQLPLLPINSQATLSALVWGTIRAAVNLL